MYLEPDEQNQHTWPRKKSCASVHVEQWAKGLKMDQEVVWLTYADG